MARSQTYRASLNFFEGESGEIRAMIVDRKTFAPSVSGALYEASACYRYQSPNTFENVMRGAQALVSWSLETGFNLDARLIQGKPLDRREIENFANWLQECMQRGDMTLRRKQVDTFNGRIRAAEAMVRWFIEMFCDGRGYELPRASIVDAALTTSKREWKNVKKRRVHDYIAPDLDDDTIKAIDTFLKNAAGPDRSGRPR